MENGSLSGLQIISADISNLTVEAVKEFGLGNKDCLRCRNMWTLRRKLNSKPEMCEI